MVVHSKKFSQIIHQKTQLVSEHYKYMHSPTKLESYDVIKTQKARQQILDFTCDDNKWNSSNHYEQYRNIFVDDQYKFMYCAVRKVSSITWSSIVRQLHNNKSGQRFFKRLLSTYKPLEIKHRLSSYVKFMFVREPMERIFSAWYDKFVNGFQKDEYEHLLGPRIVGKIRPCPHHRNCAKEILSSRHPNMNITFTEFSRYLLEIVTDIEKEDMHWNPYYYHCDPCFIKYDFIGHYETIKPDADEILRKLRIDHLVKFPEGNSSSVPLMRQHYAELGPDVTETLAHLYSLDYQMFGYSINQTLQLLGMSKP
ncbi:carbohydrate sulfotransferase 14-like [Saccoglossus kowalevskii]|uniref:Carbohydrate sulfotransferase n=1 Tax=Saccoglossus kowalevskii TaxID=10224 RepID=A0ABM0MLS7_SACKO|nr:PREDICTED: carbohydrate sulfotransferase 14-like [Saccoglossus kowalevskii]